MEVGWNFLRRGRRVWARLSLAFQWQIGSPLLPVFWKSNSIWKSSSHGQGVFFFFFFFFINVCLLLSVFLNEIPTNSLGMDHGKLKSTCNYQKPLRINIVKDMHTLTIQHELIERLIFHFCSLWISPKWWWKLCIFPFLYFLSMYLLCVSGICSSRKMCVIFIAWTIAIVTETTTKYSDSTSSNA